MIPSIHGESIVDKLLNTLEVERYMRGPLLATVIDELSAAEGLEMAAEAARAILDGLKSGQLPESDFGLRVRALRQLVQALGVPPESGEVLVAQARAELARTVARPAATGTTASAA